MCIRDRREQFAEGHGAVAIGGGKDDRRIWQDEFGEHLAAGAAGRARGVVQIGDGYGLDANLGSELGLSLIHISTPSSIKIGRAHV